MRYSLENRYAYLDANLAGFLKILEGCRHRKTAHLVYASSSSVYGANTRLPFSVRDNVDHPISLYAASKKANEAMAHAYSHLYGLGYKAKVDLVPTQPGDVPETKAHIDDLMPEVGFKPSTPIEEGIGRFVAWFRHYHSI